MYFDGSNAEAVRTTIFNELSSALDDSGLNYFPFEFTSLTSNRLRRLETALLFNLQLRDYISPPTTSTAPPLVAASTTAADFGVDNAVGVTEKPSEEEIDLRLIIGLIVGILVLIIIIIIIVCCLRRKKKKKANKVGPVETKRELVPGSAVDVKYAGKAQRVTLGTVSSAADDSAGNVSLAAGPRRRVASRRPQNRGRRRNRRAIADDFDVEEESSALKSRASRRSGAVAMGTKVPPKEKERDLAEVDSKPGLLPCLLVVLSCLCTWRRTSVLISNVCLYEQWRFCSR